MQVWKNCSVCTVVLFSILIAKSAAFVQAQPPLSGVFKRSSKEIKEVPGLKAENGPWLIFAHSFEGETAKADAETLAKEIQRDLGLTTFLMEKKFDYSSKVYGSGYREDGSQKVMKYRDARVIEGYAVMAGEFDSIDNPLASTSLEKIKSYAAPSLTVRDTGNGRAADGKGEEDAMKTAKNWLTRQSKEKPAGPMHQAFVTRNPMLPINFFQAPELEKFVYDLNRQPGYNEHSLLDCKGKYTVRVITFRGDSELVSWGRGSKEKGESSTASQLEQAAERAYIVMKALRTEGYDAYQFHDRDQSIVTVGSFDTLGNTDANNQFVYSKEIRDVVERFSPTGKLADTSEYNLNLGKAVQPRTLLELVDQRKIRELRQGDRKEQLAYFSKLSVGFDYRPTPMAVPRYNASRIYAGSKLGGR